MKLAALILLLTVSSVEPKNSIAFEVDCGTFTVYVLPPTAPNLKHAEQLAMYMAGQGKGFTDSCTVTTIRLTRRK